MAQQFKEIYYFPMSVHFFENEKIEIIEARFGLRGIGIIMKLLCKIYKESFYCKWNKDTCRIFTRKLEGEADDEFVQQLIDALLTYDFFNQDMYTEYGILTSKGIQSRYFEITARRRHRSSFPAEYILIDVSAYKNVTLTSLHADACCKNEGSIPDVAAKNEQRKGKKRKGEERKENCERECVRGETFTGNCEKWRTELQEDPEWQEAFCRQAGVESGFLELLPQKMLEFEDFIVCNAEEESILARQDYARRFHYWWLYHGRKKEEGGRKLPAGCAPFMPIEERDSSGGAVYSNPPGRKMSRIEELQQVGEESAKMALEILNAC